MDFDVYFLHNKVLDGRELFVVPTQTKHFVMGERARPESFFFGAFSY